MLRFKTLSGTLEAEQDESVGDKHLISLNFPAANLEKQVIRPRIIKGPLYNILAPHRVLLRVLAGEPLGEPANTRSSTR